MDIGLAEYDKWADEVLKQESECAHCEKYISGFDINRWKGEENYDLCPKCNKLELEDNGVIYKGDERNE